MYRHSKLLGIALIFLLACASNSYSIFGSDNKREGLFLGLGLGPGVGFTHQKLGSLVLDTTMSTWQVRIIVGKGLNERTVLSIRSQLSLYRFYNVDTLRFESDAFESLESFLQTLFVEAPAKLFTNHSNVMFNITHFLKPEAPSFYFMGGIGFSTFPTWLDHDVSPGFGFALSCGYEFKRHLAAEVEYLGSWCNETHGPNKIFRRFGSLHVTFQWLIY